MLIVFWESKNVIHTEYLNKETIINSIRFMKTYNSTTRNYKYLKY